MDRILAWLSHKLFLMPSCYNQPPNIYRNEEDIRHKQEDASQSPQETPRGITDHNRQGIPILDS